MRMDKTTVTQTAANAIVLCDPRWSPAMEAQAGDRKKSGSAIRKNTGTASGNSYKPALLQVPL